MELFRLSTDDGAGLSVISMTSWGFDDGQTVAMIATRQIRRRGACGNCASTTVVWPTSECYERIELGEREQRRQQRSPEEQSRPPWRPTRPRKGQAPWPRLRCSPANTRTRRTHVRRFIAWQRGALLGSRRSVASCVLRARFFRLVFCASGTADGSGPERIRNRMTQPCPGSLCTYVERGSAAADSHSQADPRFNSGPTHRRASPYSSSRPTRKPGTFNSHCSRNRRAAGRDRATIVEEKDVRITSHALGPRFRSK